MKFVLLVQGGIPPQEETDMYIQAFGSWIGGLRQKGIITGGLPPLARSGKVVSPTSVDAFQFTQNSVSGCIELEAASLDEAVEHAKGCPNMQYGGKVEVRDLMDMSGL
jgi:hypothetical protein